MEKQILNVNEAYNVLKEGIVVIDTYKAHFKYIKDNVVVKTSNVRYVLEVEEFLKLYKDSKFIILDDEDSFIDSKKDEEYYNFKHK